MKFVKTIAEALLIDIDAGRRHRRYPDNAQNRSTWCSSGENERNLDIFLVVGSLEHCGDM